MTPGDRTHREKSDRPWALPAILFVALPLLVVIATVLLFNALAPSRRVAPSTADASASGTGAMSSSPEERRASLPPPEPSLAGARVREHGEDPAGSGQPGGERDTGLRVRDGSRGERTDTSLPPSGDSRRRALRSGTEIVPAAPGASPPAPALPSVTPLPAGSPGPLPAAGLPEGSRPIPSDPRTTVTAVPSSASRTAPPVPSQPAPDPTHREINPPGDETRPGAEDPSSDRTAPVIVSLRFDPPELTDGNPATLLITTADNLSGVKSVAGNLRSPSGVASLPFEAQTDGGSGLFAARIMIPGKAETGLWYVGNLFVYDRVDNSLIASFTPATVPPGGTLRVTSTDSDSTPPNVREVSVQKTTLNSGEQNLIRVDVVDDGSGVASIAGDFQSPSRSAVLRFACSLNAESGFWEGVLPIPGNATCGQWTIQQIRVADNAGNIAYLSSNSPQVARAAFAVSSPDCDTSPPTLESFALSPTTVSNQAGSEILVTATVRDEGSGAVSMSGWVKGPVSAGGEFPKITLLNCSPNPNDPGAPWTCRIPVPQYTARGTWTVGLIRLEDRALNARDYGSDDQAVAQGRFDVE